MCSTVRHRNVNSTIPRNRRPSIGCTPTHARRTPRAVFYVCAKKTLRRGVCMCSDAITYPDKDRTTRRHTAARAPLHLQPIMASKIRPQLPPPLHKTHLPLTSRLLLSASHLAGAWRRGGAHAARGLARSTMCMMRMASSRAGLAGAGKPPRHVHVAFLFICIRALRRPPIQTPPLSPPAHQDGGTPGGRGLFFPCRPRSLARGRRAADPPTVNE